MKAYSRNPWLVENIDDFNFLCCPECAYKSKIEEAFISHALENHPKSKASEIFSEGNLSRGIVNFSGASLIVIYLGLLDQGGLD